MRSNLVLFPEEVERVITLLKAGGSESRKLAEEFDRRSTFNDLEMFYGAIALESLDEGDFDRDDRPALSPGEDGVYVQIWRHVPPGEVLSHLLDTQDAPEQICTVCGARMKTFRVGDQTVTTHVQGLKLVNGTEALQIDEIINADHEAHAEVS